MNSLIIIQGDIKEKIEKGFVNFKKSPKDRITLSYIETRLESLETQWMKFDATHTKLITEFKKEVLLESEYYKKDMYSQTEDLYTDYKTVLKEGLHQLKSNFAEIKNTSVSEQKGSVQNSIKLPRISIPNFSGHYLEWTTFRDLFTSLIHDNTTLTRVQKLHYLKSYLTGEAEQLLRHLPITNDNYSTCWTILQNRYNNKKYISDSIFKRFFAQKSIATESSNCLKDLHDTTLECLNALKNLGLNIESWDVLIIYILRQKLDTESRKQWEAKVCAMSEDLPKLTEFLDFLEHRFRSLEFLSTKSIKVTKSLYVTNNNTLENKSCSYCSNNNHKIGNCKEFAKKDLPTRRNFVQNSRLCFNCLGPNHSVTTCRLPTRCRICKRKHHSLLHSVNSNQSPAEVASNEQSVDSINVVVNTTTTEDDINEEHTTSYVSNTNSQVMLATALVNAETNTGSYITLRSLLDQGSQSSFITETAAQLLGLRKINSNCFISGIGGEENPFLSSKHVVYIKLQSIQDPNFTLNVKAHVLKKLTSFLPERKIMVNLWPNLPKMKLADPNCNIPNKIDLLLGSDVYCQIIAEGLMKGPPGTPIAQNTKLGWIISGKVNSDSETNNVTSCNHTITTMQSQINNDIFNLKQFWELESDKFTINNKQFTPEEIRCEELYKESTKRDDAGNYIVKLPFKVNDPLCKYGNSREIAINRFFMLEKRFDRSPDLKTHYSDVITEYLKLGHMQVIPQDEINNTEAVYLPYHEVVRNDKSTTKFRVVFNASSRDNNGISLNSDLMVGPTLQSDLRHILMRWRLHPICLVADIVKMYRQVKVSDVDANYQRVVWRANSSEDLQHLRLTRVTFGTASAPYLAVRTLHQVVYDEGEDFPLASERVLQDFYVDDLLTGCQTVSEGKQIFEEMNKLLSKGGFELQKWSSNDNKLHKDISKENKVLESNLELKTDDIIKTLGLTWNRRTDDFEYSVQLPPISQPVTKRKVVSDIAKLYDPMGWISPAIVKAKMMIQKLWLSGIEWDDVLPPKLLSEWIDYREELIELTKFKLQRWVSVKQKDNYTLELHGFSDASNEAYAAVVYVRVVDDTGMVHVHLITSKTKVAPIKQVSIPRLELCGAVLLAKLLQEVSVVLNIAKKDIHAWTDSTIVLAWLSSHPSRWKTFIANRVSEILNILDRNQWSHVSSADNPADCASRGLRPSELSDFELWKSGPIWLKNVTININKGNVTDTNLEEKTKKVYHTTKMEEFTLWTKFSSLQKLIRVVAYCKRFIKKCKKVPTIRSTSWLTTRELNEALLICIKQCQAVNFEQEIKEIKLRGITNKKSKLTSLNPFLDEFDMLRVGGRLERAEINNDSKHPMIIPSKSHLTYLLIADAHRRTFHGGPQLMLNFLRSKYWIIDAKNRVKMFVRKCVVCVRHTAITRNQLMGQLPPARVTPIRPFYRSGVDYAGPIQIRTSKGRGQRAYKGYICLFICMATKAIHLEAVSDLTSQGFLAAFKRFVARRGHCADLFSDNGTNFVGAARELKTLFAQEKSTFTMEIAECLANNGTTWHFIPPHAPHFGGLWEAGIKSTKYHLRRVIGNTTLTFEEISTLLCQIEACLNSRPMSQISTNSQDPMPLTPGHFLVGESLVLVPENNYLTSSITSLKRWQLTQKLLQHFWQRWSREYLNQFLHRYKWAHKTPEPEIGDVVLVKEDDLPPAKWVMGKITKKHKGLDNVTRVVTLKSKGVLFKRPITKLCFLPVAPETD